MDMKEKRQNEKAASCAREQYRGPVPCSRAHGQCLGDKQTPLQPPINTPYIAVQVGLEPVALRFPSRVFALTTCLQLYFLGFYIVLLVCVAMCSDVPVRVGW